MTPATNKNDMFLPLLLLKYETKQNQRLILKQSRQSLCPKAEIMNNLNKTRRKPRQISFRVAVLLAEIIAVSSNTIKGTVSFPSLGSANRSESGNSLQLTKASRPLPMRERNHRQIKHGLLWLRSYSVHQRVLKAARVKFAYSRPALKLRRRPINAPKRSGSGALRRRAV